MFCFHDSLHPSASTFARIATTSPLIMATSKPRKRAAGGVSSPAKTANPKSATASALESATANAHANDAGNKPNDHYRTKLSWLRYTLRSACLPLVRRETDILARIQQACRLPLLDAYFAWTANLASHTFYVLMLPPLFWFGATATGRDLVFVLGMGIYVTGFCKDFLCLPRPRLPPLHRITMLSYTAHEYGWPSSHLANATAVTLVLLFRLFDERASFASTTFTSLVALLGVYYFSLIVGRLYCGMHGFFDIATGTAIGTALFAFRRIYGPAYDAWLLHSLRNSLWLGVAATYTLMIAAHLWLLHVYPEPVDDCPCFDDSVAFVGVLLGLDMSHYACVLSGALLQRNGSDDPLLIPYNPARGILIDLSRFVLGVALVSTWKAVLKPVVFTVLPPLYKLFGLNLPRSHYISTAHASQSNRHIRRQSISNMRAEPMELDGVLDAVRSHETDKVGPENDIDAYELLDYQSTHKSLELLNVTISGVFRPRYDVEIIGRCIIYAGISTITVWGFAYGVEVLGLA